MFDEARAVDDLKRYHEDGPDPTTRALLDVLRKVNLEGARVLDVGGGIGVIHHELLDAGAASAVHVEASQAFLRAARQEAERRGHRDVQFLVGDFVAMAEDIASADIVTLDRVICCYGDMESLVRESARRAERYYGAVYPRDRWYLRIAFAAINFWKWLTRSPFRVYVHAVAAIEDAIIRQGLVPKMHLKTFIWHVAVFARQ